MTGEISPLEVRLEATIKKFERNMRKAGRLVEGFEDTAGRSTARASRRIRDNLDRSSRAFDANARSQTQFRGALQNTSFQLQDIVVQIQGGTSATRALSQQLPQLLGGFGAMGAALGLVAGLGIPVVSTLLSIGGAAEELDATNFDGLKSSMSELHQMEIRYSELIAARAQAQSDASNAVIDQLGKEINLKRAQMELERIQVQARRDQLAEQVRLEREAIDASVRSAPGNLNAQERADTAFVYSADQRRQVEEAAAAFDALDQARVLRLREMSAELEVQNLLLDQFGRLLDGASEETDRIASATGETATAVERIAARMDHAYRSYAATRLEAQAAADAARAQIAELEAQAAMQELIRRHGADSLEVTEARVRAERDAFEETLATREISDELRASLLAAWDAAAGIASIDMSGNITLAANEAARLAQNLAAAGAAAAPGGPDQARFQVMDATSAAATAPGRVVGGLYGVVSQRTFNSGAGAGAGARGRRGGSGGGGGGGGTGDAARVHNDRLREAARIFEDTRNEAERYATELENLNSLHKAGYIDADTFNRALADLNEDFEAAGLKRIEEGILGIADAMADAIVNGENLAEAFRAQLKQMAADLIASGLRDLIGGLFRGSGLGAAFGGLLPNANGNAFSSGRVVPFASGGVVTGPTLFPMRGVQTGLMGEAGPEAIMPLTRLPSGKLGVAAQGGGGGRVEVVARVEGGEIVQTIERVSGDVAARVTQAGLSHFNEMLPDRVKQIQRDPRAR